MSCSVWLVDNDHIGYPDHLFDGITYNLSPMFREATGGLLFRDLEGRSGAECGRILRAAFQRLASDPARFEAMNPENGWGDYNGLVEVVARAAVVAARHPDAVAEFCG